MRNRQTVVKRGQKAKGKSEVPCEVYSRIVGYLRPVSNWNIGKQQEWADRQEYDVVPLLAT